jgi:multicomponent Na+:H+ antiporter subunit F
VSPQRFAVVAVLPLLSLAVVAAVVRLVRGPTLPDRVVAFDLLSALGMCILAAYAVATDQDVFIDVTVILALVSFLGTIGFAFYLRRRA